MMDMETQRLFDSLVNEIGFLHGIYQIFKDIDSSENPDKAFKGAEALIQVLRWLTFDEICLSICRVLDPARTRKYEHASLYSLRQGIKGVASDEVLSAFQRSLREAAALASPFRAWRNDRVAHNDIKVIARRGQIPPIDSAQIAAMLQALAIVMNVVHSGMQGYSMDYDGGIFRGDVRRLQTRLQRAQDHIQCLLQKTNECGQKQ